MSTVPHTTTDFTSTTADAPDTIRATYRDAVATVADRAKTALPACSGRIDKAVQLVLSGDVELLPDGTGARVASQTKAGTVYFAVNGSCQCKDAPKAPQGFCKHRLAYGIAKRAYTLASTMLDVPVAAPADGACWVSVNDDGEPCHAAAQACPHTAPLAAPSAMHTEAPASVNVRIQMFGREVQWTLRDSDEVRLLDRLMALLQRFPVEVPVPSTSAAPGTTAPAATPSQAPDVWCALHEVWMKRTTKNGDFWHSHRVPGGWCKGQDK